jgi:hypothetical protein
MERRRNDIQGRRFTVVILSDGRCRGASGVFSTGPCFWPDIDDDCDEWAVDSVEDSSEQWASASLAADLAIVEDSSFRCDCFCGRILTKHALLLCGEYQE